MGGKRNKRLDAAKNKRLDLFLSNLEIEEEKRKQIIGYVEGLTFEALKGRSSGPRLRLKALDMNVGLHKE